MGILVPLNVFLFAKTLLVGWGLGEKRPFYTASKVCFFYTTEQIFLWIPYSQSFMIDNEGSCRNGGGGGTDNPLGIQLCSKGVLGQVVPGDGHLTNALHS